jgi:hypothetical protein
MTTTRKKRISLDYRPRVEIKHMELQQAGVEGSAMSHSMNALHQNLTQLNHDLQTMLAQNTQQLEDLRCERGLEALKQYRRE